MDFGLSSSIPVGFPSLLFSWRLRAFPLNPFQKRHLLRFPLEWVFSESCPCRAVRCSSTLLQGPMRLRASHATSTDSEFEHRAEGSQVPVRALSPGAETNQAQGITVGVAVQLPFISSFTLVAFASFLTMLPYGFSVVVALLPAAHACPVGIHNSTPPSVLSAHSVT
eukprot:1118775-Amphidinium_carterae.4